MEFDKAVDLQQFKISKMPKNSNFFLIGKRNSGKSNYLEYALLTLCNEVGFGKVAVLSRTEEQNHFYRDKVGVDPDFIRSEPDVEFVTRIRFAQRYISSQLEEKDPKAKDDLRNWLLLIIDDFAYDKGLMQCKALREIMYNNRHDLICVAVIAQNVIAGSAKDNRGQFDFVIMTRANQLCDQKDIYNNLFGLFDNFTTFRQTMLKHTSKFGVLIADYSSCSKDNPMDQVFWDRAPDLKGKKLKLPLNYQSLEPFRKFIRESQTGNSIEQRARKMTLARERELVKQVEHCVKKHFHNKPIKARYLLTPKGRGHSTSDRHHNRDHQRSSSSSSKRHHHSSSSKSSSRRH